MTEGFVKIYMSVKEPDKNVLWLRPRLCDGGYDLLYYGSKGWELWQQGAKTMTVCEPMSKPITCDTICQD